MKIYISIGISITKLYIDRLASVCKLLSDVLTNDQEKILLKRHQHQDEPCKREV